MIESMNMYTRQESIKLNRVDKMVIIGCGGIGANLALKAGMVGIKEFILIDFDTVSYHNLGRTPFLSEQVGGKKVDAVKEIIQLYRKNNFRTLYSAELSSALSTKTEDDLIKMMVKGRDLEKEFEQVNSSPNFTLINPRDNTELYAETLSKITNNRKEYLVVDCTDNYLEDEELENSGITLLADYKLNYDGTQMAILSNPYAKKAGKFKIPLATVRLEQGYSVISSLFLTPDFITSAFIMFILTKKNGAKVKSNTTEMINIDTVGFLEKMFSFENSIRFN